MKDHSKEKARPRTLLCFRDKAVHLPDRHIPLGGKEFRKEGVEFDVSFMEGVLHHDPCHEEALQVLGHAYTIMGEHEKGLKIDRRLTRLRPEDPVAFYNLACSLSLTEQLDGAFDALRRAIQLGYVDMGHMLKDPDLENLRRDPRFRSVLQLIRKSVKRRG